MFKSNSAISWHHQTKMTFLRVRILSESHTVSYYIVELCSAIKAALWSYGSEQVCHTIPTKWYVSCKIKSWSVLSQLARSLGSQASVINKGWEGNIRGLGLPPAALSYDPLSSSLYSSLCVMPSLTFSTHCLFLASLKSVCFSNNLSPGSTVLMETSLSPTFDWAALHN